jgi:hypothetical protein
VSGVEHGLVLATTEANHLGIQSTPVPDASTESLLATKSSGFLFAMLAIFTLLGSRGFLIAKQKK